MLMWHLFCSCIKYKYITVHSSMCNLLQIRRFSPLLESSLLSGNDGLVSDDWKTVPDIWRTSADKFGDKIALIDPYHDPPSTMTYKQVFFQLILPCELQDLLKDCKPFSNYLDFYELEVDGQCIGNLPFEMSFSCMLCNLLYLSYPIFSWRMQYWTLLRA